MIKIKKYIYLAIAGTSIMGCSSDKDNISPADISNIVATPGPGYIHLKWDMPEDRSSIHYTQVTYYDHLDKMNAKRLSSVDTIRIPNTRNKYGEYEFTLETVSPTGSANGNTHSVTSISDKAPTTEVAYPIKLTEGQLSTNAQEPSEGPIKNLVDGNSGTYFVTRWSSPVPPAPHWIQIDLEEELTTFNFGYDPRDNAGGSYPPTNFDLLISYDGENWTLLKKFTKESDGLPVDSKSYKSPTLKANIPFKHLKLAVHETSRGSAFWTMSEFRMAKVSVEDPEAIDEEDVSIKEESDE